jgi:hypothetical protein
MNLDNLKLINEKNQQAQLDSKKHQELLLDNTRTQETIVKSFNALVRYLDNQVSKTHVTNQLKEIGTPDALKVVSAVDSLHETLKTHENTDLSEITKVMQSILSEAEKIPKSHNTIDIPKPIDNTKQLDNLVKAIKSVEKVVKEQKLIAEAPIINVPETNVNVEAPDLQPLQASIKDVVGAVKKIVIPEYKTDNKEVEKLITKSNRLLKELIEKPVGGGGGGGSSWVAVNTSGIPMPIELDASGNVPVSGSVTTAAPTAIRNGKKTVASAGTAEVIVGSSTTVVGVVIQALESNTGLVYIGDSSVDSTNGMELQAGQATGLAIDNLNKVYVDAAVNGEGVCFIGS